MSSDDEKIVMREGETLATIDGWQRCSGCSRKVEVVETKSGKKARMIKHRMRADGLTKARQCPGSGAKFETKEVDMSTFGSPYNLEQCDQTLRDYFGLSGDQTRYVWEDRFSEVLLGAAQLGVPFVISGNGSHLPSGAGAPLMFNINDDGRYTAASGDKFSLQVCLAIGSYIEKNYIWDGKTLVRR